MAAGTINARSKTAATKPTFRDPLKYRRCLIPADGPYEWKRNGMYQAPMGEGRKRTLTIAAAILVARHLKTPEALYNSTASPRTESLIASGVQLAERIMRNVPLRLIGRWVQTVRS